MRARLTLVAILLAALVGVVAPAQADIFDDFRNNGRINTCNYSEGQLRSGLKNLPPDVQQYAPGLADQLAGGRGGCGGGGGGGTSDIRRETVGAIGAADSGRPAAPDVPKPPAVKGAAKQRLRLDVAPRIANVSQPGPDVPTAVWGFLAVLLFGGLGYLIARFNGWSPDRFTAPLRASAEELSGRLSDATRR